MGTSTVTPIATATEPDALRPSTRCRANSRRGLIDAGQRSYPPVEAVQRALEVLRTVNLLRIASVSMINAATGIPKSTIVRMLETLIAEGYIVRDNLCGGYRVTVRTHELHAGYEGISQLIAASRAHAIELTRRTNFPVAIGVFDGTTVVLKFWTGTISPLAHTNTVLGLRPDLTMTAMGRAYLAFILEEEREQLLQRLRDRPEDPLTPRRERELRRILHGARKQGYATRAPQIAPARMNTLAVPIRAEGKVLGLMGITFFATSIPACDVPERVFAPLRATVAQAEDNLALLRAAPSVACMSVTG